MNLLEKITFTSSQNNFKENMYNNKLLYTHIQICVFRFDEGTVKSNYKNMLSISFQ